jgi:CheY-like chemotaxis protein
MAPPMAPEMIDAADHPGLAHAEPQDIAGHGRLLIVDDEEVFAGSLQRLLSAEHDVTVLTSGRAALDRLCAGERFDAIVCDLMMPGTSGVELHSELARTAPDQAERMIFLTGGVFSRRAQQFLENVANRWFEKPCNLQELRAAIRRQIARSRGM